MIIITGQPGAGKTVQGELLKKRLGLHWLSTGHLFREGGSPKIQKILASGKLVDNETVNKLVGKTLLDLELEDTVLLDGYPRTPDQAEWLLLNATALHKQIQLVLYLTVSEETTVARLNERRSTLGRADDNEKVIIQRQKEAEKIAPTIAALRSKGVPVEEVDANGTVEEIFENIQALLQQYQVISKTAHSK